MHRHPPRVSIPYQGSRETAEREEGREGGEGRKEPLSWKPALPHTGHEQVAPSLGLGLLHCGAGQAEPLSGLPCQSYHQHHYLTAAPKAVQPPSAHHWGNLSHNQCPGPLVFPQISSSSQLGLGPPMGKIGTWDLLPSRQPHPSPAQRDAGSQSWTARGLTLAQMLAALTTG